MDDRKTWKNKDSDKLFKAILTLKTVEECERFFRDLMTVQEIETFSARFKAAQMILNGDSYRKIYAKTGVSTATVTRINQWLEKGLGGYKMAIDRLNKPQATELMANVKINSPHHPV